MLSYKKSFPYSGWNVHIVFMVMEGERGDLVVSSPSVEALYLGLHARVVGSMSLRVA